MLHTVGPEQESGHYWNKMTFWQENYSFIKEVYDTRYMKMVEWMDNVEMAVQKVLASKVYTSAEVESIWSVRWIRSI